MKNTWLITIFLAALFLTLLAQPGSTALAQAGTGTQTPTVQPIFAVETVTPAADGSVVHEVLPGQTLVGIAEAYQVSLATIAALNNLTTPYTIFPGDKLIIRPQPTPTVTAAATETQQATARPTATQRPPTATPKPTLIPTATMTPTATPWLRAPSVTVTTKGVGIALIGICVIGLVVVGLTGFRKS